MVLEETQPATQAHDVDSGAEGGGVDAQQPVGRLVSLNDSIGNADVWEDGLTIGRRPGNTITFADPRISGHHCRLFVEAKHDSDHLLDVWIEDLSANGTFINGQKLGRNKRLILAHGDAVSLVMPHGHTHNVIAYMFHDIRQRVPAQESEIDRDYALREELGRGNFAVVRMGVHKADGHKVAVKVIDKKKSLKHHQPGDRDVLMDEVSILRSMSHPRIIEIHDVYETPDSLYLVLELVTGGELFDRIVAKRFYPEPDAKKIFLQLVEALQYLHSRGIAHRDLKPENILLVSRDDDTTIKLSDFGVSRVVDSAAYMSTICGTPQYLAPEVLEHAKTSAGYTKQCDLWSLGVILYILLCGFPPFVDTDGAPLYQNIASGAYSFPSPWWDKISPEAKVMVERLLTVDPAQRITLDGALKHSWITLHSYRSCILPDMTPTNQHPRRGQGKQNGSTSKKSKASNGKRRAAAAAGPAPETKRVTRSQARRGTA